MDIYVAGERKTHPDGLTVSELLSAEKVENPLYVTVSINEELVDQGAFGQRTLSEGDRVEFLYFMGGGRR